MNHARLTAYNGARRGFTLPEVVLSAVLVSLLFVVAVQVASASNVAQYKTSERATGRMLGGALMTEILGQAYEQPGGAAGSWGLDAPELASSRANYNDVDDYNGWSDNPIRNKDMSKITDLSGWSRSVLVERVNASDLSVAASDTLLKRITVTVKHNNVTVCTRVALKSNAT